MQQPAASFSSFLQRSVGIRTGEWRRALALQGIIFLIISTLLIVKPTVNGLFLAKFGVESLPLAYVLVAVSATLVSLLYARLLNRLQLPRIMGYTLGISILVLLGFGLLLRTNLLEGGVLYAFYIWVAVFAVLATSQFWVLANLIFSAREAKRLFGFIGAGAIAGGIFGGYLTSLFAPLMGSENLLFVSAALLLAAWPLIRWLWAGHRQIAPFGIQAKKRTPDMEHPPWQLFRRSRHLSIMALIVGLSVIVAKLVDYQFSALASKEIPDPDELTAFFGFWLSTLNILSLAIQLLLTNRIVGVWGVGTSLFFLPLGIGLGAVLLLLFPSLWAAIFIKAADGSLKQSVNKAATELLSVPIPIEIRNRTKPFIDVFVDSLATGLVGLVLIFIIQGLDLASHWISILTLALICFWLYWVYQVKGEYLKAFKSRLAARSETEVAASSPSLSEQESVIGGIRKVLAQGSEPEILRVLHMIRPQDEVRWFGSYRRLLQHPNAEIRAAALQNLYGISQFQVREEALALSRDSDPRVRVAAIEYLLGHAPGLFDTQVVEFLSDPDPEIRACTLVSLAKETRQNPLLAEQYGLAEHLGEELILCREMTPGPARNALQMRLLQAIGHARLPAFFPEIRRAFKDSDPEMQIAGILAAGQTLNPVFVPELFALLTQPTLHQALQTAFTAFGPKVSSYLLPLVAAPETTVAQMRYLPRMLTQIRAQSVVDFLFGLLDYEDLTVRIESLKSLISLRKRFPGLAFHQGWIVKKIMNEAALYQETLAVLYAQRQLESNDAPSPIAAARQSLVELLEKRLDGHLERIFHLLGLRYPPEDIFPIYEGLQSKQAEQREHAVTFLDNLLAYNLKRVLIPIIETLEDSQAMEAQVSALKLTVPDEQECFLLLLQGKDVKIKQAVLYLIAQSKDPRYRGLVEPYVDHPNPMIRDFAVKAHQALNTP